MEQLREVFNSFDEDQDGEIETVLVERAIRVAGFNPSADDMAGILEDLQGKQSVSFNAFAYICHHLSKYCDVKADLVHAFSTFDRDGTGKISAADVRKILSQLKRPLTEHQIDVTLSNLAVDNGFLDYRQLVDELMKK